MQKLLAMLASEQPGEADAARRKLVEHLAGHRLSLTDIAIRLGDRSPKPSFVQGARERNLDRLLAIARDARQEAEREASHARARLEELQGALQHAKSDAFFAWQGRSQMRLRAILASATAVLCLFILLATRLPALTRPATAPVRTQETLTLHAPPSDEVLRLAPGERLGTVLVQDLQVRLTPYDNAGVRAFLNQGMRVVIERQSRVGIENWLQIRSVTGSGWVRASDVLH